MTYDITLAYIHPGWVHHQFFDSVLRLMSDVRFRVMLVQEESGANVQIARNDCVRWYLKNSEASHILFADTDMAFSSEVVAQLIGLDLPIVSALYMGRGGDGKGFPVGMKWATPEGPDGVDGEGRNMLSLTAADITGEVLEVGGVGMGCCVIKREVIESLADGDGTHPDQWPFAVGQTQLAHGGYMSLGEDITFCVRAKLQGHKSYLATNLGVGHVKSFIIEPPSPQQVSTTLGQVPDFAAMSRVDA